MNGLDAFVNEFLVVRRLVDRGVVLGWGLLEYILLGFRSGFGTRGADFFRLDFPIILYSLQVLCP